MRVLFLLALLVVLSGCKPPDIEDGEYPVSRFSIQCLGGVEYYLSKSSGYRGYMSAVIDRHTLKPKLCD